MADPTDNATQSTVSRRLVPGRGNPDDRRGADEPTGGRRLRTHPRVTVRTVTREHIPQLAELWKSMLEHHRQVLDEQWPVREPEDSWHRQRALYLHWLDTGTGFVLGAHADGRQQLAGYLACHLLPAGPTFDLGDTRGDVDSLVTAKGLRSHGIGSALLSACREELSRRGVHYWSIGVVDANTHAADLYRRLGFQPFLRTMLRRVEPSPAPEPSVEQAGPPSSGARALDSARKPRHQL